jgi:hypothetical protein
MIPAKRGGVLLIIYFDAPRFIRRELHATKTLSFNIVSKHRLLPVEPQREIPSMETNVVKRVPGIHRDATSLRLVYLSKRQP